MQNVNAQPSRANLLPGRPFPGISRDVITTLVFIRPPAFSVAGGKAQLRRTRLLGRKREEAQEQGLDDKEKEQQTRSELAHKIDLSVSNRE